MNRNIEQEMINILESEPSLRIYWTEPPQVMFVPFMKSREAFFAAVNLLVLPTAANLETLNAILTGVVTILNRSGLMKDLQGIEIRPVLQQGSNEVRVLRFSVRKESLAKVNSLVPTDLLKTKPLEGITCKWFISPPTE